jgi:hypothetical protein
MSITNNTSIPTSSKGLTTSFYLGPNTTNIKINFRNQSPFWAGNGTWNWQIFSVRYVFDANIKINGLQKRFKNLPQHKHISNVLVERQQIRPRGIAQLKQTCFVQSDLTLPSKIIYSKRTGLGHFTWWNHILPNGGERDLQIYIILEIWLRMETVLPPTVNSILECIRHHR